MRLRKGFIYVFTANAINLVVNAVSGLLLPIILSVDTYANISLYQLYITYIGILHFGFSDGMYLKYGGKNINEISRKEIFSEFRTFKFFQFTIATIATVISLVLGDALLLMCSLSILPINIGNYLRNLYQATGKFDKYARFTNVNTFLIFAMNLILLFAIRSDYYLAYIATYVVAYSAYWIFLEMEIGKTIERVSAPPNKKYLIENVRDGFQLMIGNFCTVLFTSIDRLFVKRFFGIIEFAYFSFAVNIQSLMYVFISPLTVIMYNYFCKVDNPTSIIRIKNTVTIAVSFLMASSFVVKFAIENYIIKYSEAIPIIFILFVAQYFSIIVKSVYINLYKAQKRQNRYFKVVLFIIVLSILLNILFYTISHSIVSVALSTAVVSIVWFIICEMDFKEYKYTLKQYSYIIITLLSFILSGIYFGSICGAILYISTLFVSTYFIMRHEFNYMAQGIAPRLKYIFTRKKDK